MNARKLKKMSYLLKNFKLLFSKKKCIALKLLELQEQIMIDNFLIQIDYFEKTGKFFISLVNLNIKFPFRN